MIIDPHNFAAIAYQRFIKTVMAQHGVPTIVMETAGAKHQSSKEQRKTGNNIQKVVEDKKDFQIEKIERKTERLQQQEVDAVFAKERTDKQYQFRIAKAEVLFSRGDLGGALEEITDYLVSDPDNATALSLRLKILHTQEHRGSEEQRKTEDRVPEVTGEKVDSQAEKVESTEENSQRLGGEAGLAEEKKDKQRQFRIAKAEVLFNQGNLDRALEEITDYLLSDPDNLKALSLRLKILQAQQDLGEPLKIPDEVQEVAEEQIDSQAEKVESKEEHSQQHGDDADLAKKKKDKNHQFRIAKAEVLFNRGDFGRALEEITGYLVSDPDNATALSLRSTILQAQQSLEDQRKPEDNVQNVAEEKIDVQKVERKEEHSQQHGDDANLAKKKKTKKRQHRIAKAEVLLNRGDLGEALEEITDYLVSHPDNATALSLRSEIVQAQQRLEDQRKPEDNVQDVAEEKKDFRVEKIESNKENSRQHDGDAAVVKEEKDESLDFKFTNAEILFNRGDLNEALEEITDYLVSHPDNATALSLRLKILHTQAQQDSKEQHKTEDEVPEVAEEKIDVQAEKIESNEGNSQPHAGDAGLLKEKMDERYNFKFANAEILFNRGDLGGALEEITNYLVSHPDNSRALSLRLKILHRQAQQDHETLKEKTPQREEAPPKETPKREVLKKEPVAPIQAIDRKKNSFTGLWWIVASTIVIIVGTTIGIVFWLHRETPSNLVIPATSVATDASREAPARVVTTESIESLLSRGETFAKKKEYLSALNEYQKVIALAPNKSEAYLAEGNIYGLVGKYDDAMNALSQAFKLNPKDTTVLLTLASVKHLSGLPIEAVQYLDMTLPLVADSNQYLSGPIANAIMFDPVLLARYGGRVSASFERGLKIKSKDYVTKYRFARLLQAMNKTKEAKALFESNIDQLLESIQVDQNDGRSMIYLALILTREGRFQEAISFADDARQSGKNDPEILYKISQMYALQMRSPKKKDIDNQKKKRALEALREALVLDYRVEELTNADFYNLLNQGEFQERIKRSLK
ncbi:MAG: tetratricopeptide repeat protein [Ignavibacteria bacterium]|nr:tetratricopeptide repeat protein [Ignavibacteria bacterium]